MITIEQVLRLHEKSIEVYGGAHGIRDNGLLESAVARPYQTFDGADLYTDIFRKAAAIMESIIVNHPFIDGNKRTGFLTMFAMLRLNNYKLSATETEAYDVSIKVSTGKIEFEDLVSWIKQYSEAT